MPKTGLLGPANCSWQLDFCKIEIRHTLKGKDLSCYGSSLRRDELFYFSFSNSNCLKDNYLARYVPASLSQAADLFELLFLLQKGNWVYAIDFIR